SSGVGASENGTGTHASTRASGNANDAGITPTTVVALPSSVIVFPRMPASAPYRLTHRPCDRTTVGAGPRGRSSGSHAPASGATRRTDASDGVVNATRTRSALPPWPVMV